jgi:hypothetical protein
MKQRNGLVANNNLSLSDTLDLSKKFQNNRSIRYFCAIKKIVFDSLLYGGTFARAKYKLLQPAMQELENMGNPVFSSAAYVKKLQNGANCIQL